MLDLPAPKLELKLTRLLEAPRPLVFSAWTELRHARAWWGPQGFVNLVCEMDVRPGGAWRRVMRSPTGDLVVKRGVYREIRAPERLVFTYLSEDAAGLAGEETLVTLTFAEEDRRTRLTLLHALFSDVRNRDDHEGGWTSCLARFAAFLADADKTNPME